MLAVLMDGGSHMKRPWDDQNRSPDGRPMMQMMSDPLDTRLNAAQLPNMPSPGHMLPPIITATEQPSRQMPPDRLPATSILPGGPQRPPHAQLPQAPSSKRPRLYYDASYSSDFGRGQPSAHGSPGEIPPTGHERHEQHQQWSKWESPKPDGNNHTPRDLCQICADSKGLVEKVVSGLERLEAELRSALASSPLNRAGGDVGHSTSAPPNAHLRHRQESTEPPGGPYLISEAGIKDSLIWANNSVEASTRLVREFAASQRALPRITVPNLGMTPAHEQPSAITSAPADYARGFMDRQERERPLDSYRRFGPPYQPDYQLRPSDSSQPPPSPHPTVSSGTAYMSSQSPRGIGAPTRMLPSPSSLHTAPSISSVPANHSPNSNQSPHTTHLQDLQHQVSTKSLAFTTLHREHEQLLAAYSRMQIRCQTLDKKSQVSDHEINTLAEEKLRLQSQVDAFEVQVEDLVNARDEAQKANSASAAQYMRIVAMSSKLQLQSAEEAKRYKQDRDAWERDREGLQRHIEDLEARRPDSKNLRRDGSVETKGPPLGLDDILASTSLELLRYEVVRLRQSLLKMERLFDDLRQETGNLDHVMTECASIRERLGANTSADQQQPIEVVSTGNPEEEPAEIVVAEVDEEAKDQSLTEGG